MSFGRRLARVVPPALRPGLLARLVAALVLVGTLPLLVTWLQLRGQEDALVEQVQRTHTVAAAAAATRIDAFVDRTLDLAESLAAQPAFADPAGAAAQELLRGALGARDDLRAVGLFDPAGATVVLARRAPIGPAVEELFAADAELQLSEPQKADETVPRLLAARRSLQATDGWVAVVAGADELDEILQPVQLGEEAALLLVSDALELLDGDSHGGDGLGAVPAEVLEQARGGRIGSGVRVVRGGEDDGADGSDAPDRVVAFARVESAPWFVVSTQPTRVAEVARERIVDAGRRAALAAALLTVVLTLLAWQSVVRPLRRLAAAQRDLVGHDAGGSGDEIAQLERSFAVLRQRVAERRDLGQVFLGRYEVTDLIGEGAMGSVFRGWDGKLDRPVALKTIHLDAARADTRRLVDSLRQEAAVTARLSQPNIVTVYDIEDHDASAFIAMELVDGINLRRLLETRGRIDPDLVAPLLLEIARGLAAAHRNHLVHHDVKPANILLGHDGSVKLTDFGISQTLTAAARDPEVICGTPGYIAPEVLNGGDYETSSDLWALGVVGYECITGEQPFRAGDLHRTIVRTMTHEPPPVRSVVPGTDPELSRLLAELMSHEPVERTRSSDRVVDTLDAICRARDLRWALDLQAAETPAVARPGTVAGTRLITRRGVPRDGLGTSLDA